jgi:hypothetical protein
LDEYNSYRQSGELPERFKPAEKAESATVDPQEETEESEAEEAETASESETEEEAQEHPLTKGAEKRIKQLLAKTKELEAQLASKQDVKQEVKTESSPVRTTRPKPTAEDKAADGNPKYSTYEDFVEDLADWKAEQRIETVKREQAQQEAMKALNSTLEKARERYEDADDVIFPAAKTINEAKIPQAVKEVFAGSDMFIDLCYVVGSDPDELQKFVKLAETNPRAAIGKVFEYERGIKEELAKSTDGGKAPEPKKTSAPKPPSPVGGGSTRAFDVSDESLSPEEWMRKRNSELEKRK